MSLLTISCGQHVSYMLPEVDAKENVMSGALRESKGNYVTMRSHVLKLHNACSRRTIPA